MLKQLKRKRGAQPHNRNAVTHGRFTAEAKAARAAWWDGIKAERAEQEKRSDEWIKAQPGYVTDYDAIIERMLQEQRERDLADAGAATPPVQGKAPARR
jgi:hypothetical protein